VQSRLFKVVSFITGFKNSMKGVGYFIGAAALMFNYYFALGLMLLLVAAAMPWAFLGLSNQLGRCGTGTCFLCVFGGGGVGCEVHVIRASRQYVLPMMAAAARCACSWTLVTNEGVGSGAIWWEAQEAVGFCCFCLALGLSFLTCEQGR
jgi:hypothetical protein